MPKKKLLPTLPGLSDGSEFFLMILQEETDRGVALVGAAFIDDILDAMLRAYFVDEPKVVNELLESERPLSTFSAKIHLVYCLGLIGPRMYNDLNLIRKMRNEFAHHHWCYSFQKAEIKSYCNKLQAIEILPPDFKIKLTSRDRFITSVVQCYNELIVKGLSLQHIKPGKDLKFSTK